MLADVGLDDWVVGLTDGLDTQLGEHGYRLSGGQRKRLVVARALLADAPVGCWTSRPSTSTHRGQPR